MNYIDLETFFGYNCSEKILVNLTTLKRSVKLALISLFAAFSSSPLLANVYRIDFQYGADTGGSGGLDGFMVLDLSLDTGNERNSPGNTHFTPIPNWITQISLTFDPDDDDSTNNSVTKTRSDFRKVNWNLGGSTFDVNQSFSTQFTSFGFTTNDGDDTFNTGGLVQQYTAGGAGNEFPLDSTATTPGGLPFLGLGALFYYYRKLKNKSLKN